MSWRARCLFGVVFALCAAGCDLAATYRKCGLSGCSGDAAITANIEGQLARRSDVFANDISVQTLDHVVYVRGLIDTDVQRETILAVAQQMPGVERVVDSLVLRNEPGF